MNEYREQLVQLVEEFEIRHEGHDDVCRECESAGGFRLNSPDEGSSVWVHGDKCSMRTAKFQLMRQATGYQIGRVRVSGGWEPVTKVIPREKKNALCACLDTYGPVDLGQCMELTIDAEISIAAHGTPDTLAAMWNWALQTAKDAYAVMVEVYDRDGLDHYSAIDLQPLVDFIREAQTIGIDLQPAVVPLQFPGRVEQVSKWDAYWMWRWAVGGLAEAVKAMEAVADVLKITPNQIDLQPLRDIAFEAKEFQSGYFGDAAEMPGCFTPHEIDR